MLINKKRGITSITIILIVIGILVLASGWFYYYKTLKEVQPKACTQEAKICPDGTSVGRTGPNCEFAPCPKECVVDSDCYPPGFILGKCGPFYTCGSGKCYEGSAACPRI